MKKQQQLILGPKGKALLKIICKEISSGRIQKRKPETFITYSEALHL
jgi:hypothetical protein